MNLALLLKRHEGVRLKPYRDTEGKLTIGVGRNLEDVGITAQEAEIMLIHDIDSCLKEIAHTFPWMSEFDDVRIAVVASMIFNMGLLGFLEFKKMIQALQLQNFEVASKEMLSSKWANQVGSRARELSEMMRTGNYLTLGENNCGNS